MTQASAVNGNLVLKEPLTHSRPLRSTLKSGSVSVIYVEYCVEELSPRLQVSTRRLDESDLMRLELMPLTALGVSVCARQRSR